MLIEIDALIIGAGPVGLFQVFELGLLEIKAHVVDSLPVAGGQCIELYADKPLYDIPGLPVCTGRELIARLLKQIEPMATSFHLGQEVSSLQRQDDGRFAVATTQGTQFLARTVFMAGGVGSFQPRSVKVEGLQKHEGSQLLHHVDRPADFAGQRIVILGDSDEAIDWAVHFAQGETSAASVTLLHRRDSFQAAPASVERMRELCAAQKMRFIAGQITGVEEHNERLVAVKITTNQGATETLRADVLLALLGLSPKLGPIAEWGLAMERKQLVVNTATFETSVPGIFAVGDINTYPGKRKLILCGFHEATLAAFGAASHLRAGQPVPLEYTTTSKRLHRVLGVQGPTPG